MNAVLRLHFMQHICLLPSMKQISPQAPVCDGHARSFPNHIRHSVSSLYLFSTQNQCMVLSGRPYILNNVGHMIQHGSFKICEERCRPIAHIVKSRWNLYSPLCCPYCAPSRPCDSSCCFTFPVAWLVVQIATWPQMASCLSVATTVNHLCGPCTLQSQALK